jgi:SAM-dependent methyltransferase
MAPTPDWQLPPGVDRGLWDYLHSDEMAAGYDKQVAASPLAKADIEFCEKWFSLPGRLLDLGCGTGRLCRHFAANGYECVGVDLSDEMLKKAGENINPLRGSSPRGSVQFINGNLVDLAELPDASFDFAACLFSTLGMVRGTENRLRVVHNASRLLKPGGRFLVHVHNRFFRGLGWRNWGRGDITMPQSYGGAPLTLHHFSLREALRVLSPFEVREVRAVGIDGHSAGRPETLRAYGYLSAVERRSSTKLT